jgi:hypothetical protein
MIVSECDTRTKQAWLSLISNGRSCDEINMEINDATIDKSPSQKGQGGGLWTRRGLWLSRALSLRHGHLRSNDHTEQSYRRHSMQELQVMKRRNKIGPEGIKIAQRFCTYRQGWIT